MSTEGMAAHPLFFCAFQASNVSSESPDANLDNRIPWIPDAPEASGVIPHRQMGPVVSGCAGAKGFLAGSKQLLLKRVSSYIGRTVDALALRADEGRCRRRRGRGGA
jgi:hypothetical protein